MPRCVVLRPVAHRAGEWLHRRGVGAAHPAPLDLARLLTAAHPTTAHPTTAHPTTAATLSAIRRPISSDDVAAGDGALQTWVARFDSMIAKSSTKEPSRWSSC